MNQYNDDVSGQGAPAEPSSDAAADHPSGLSIDDVRRVLHEEFGPALANAINGNTATHYRGMQTLMDARITEIQKALGVTREVAEGVKAIANKALDPTELEGLNERQRTAEMQRQLTELQQQTAAAQQAQAFAAQQQAQQRAIEQQARQQGALNEAVWTSQVTQMREYAESQGVDFDAAYKANAQAHAVDGTHRLPAGTKDDPTGIARYYKAFQKVVDRMASTAEQEAQPRVRADATRAAGGGPPKRFTVEQVAKMTPAEYQANRDAILGAARR